MLAAEGITFTSAPKASFVAARGPGRVACAMGRRKSVLPPPAATGRRPNTDDLGLDAAGIARDACGFITVDDTLRTSVPGVWALGDATAAAP